MNKNGESPQVSCESQHHLRSFRKQRGLTLQQVSEGTGLSVPALHAIEQHQREAKLTTAFKLARFYGVQVADIWQPLLKQIICATERTEGQRSGGNAPAASLGLEKVNSVTDTAKQ